MTFYFIWLCSSRKCCYIPVLHWLFADRHILNLAELLFICPVMLLHYFEVKLTTPCIVLTLYWPFIFFSLVNCRYFRGAFFLAGCLLGVGVGGCFVSFCFVLWSCFCYYIYYQRWETPKLQMKSPAMCILLFSCYCFDTVFFVSFSIFITFLKSIQMFLLKCLSFFLNLSKLLQKCPMRGKWV